MNKWSIRISRFYHLCLEMVLLFLITMPIYFLENKPLPIIAFVITVVTALIFYDPFIKKYQNKKVGFFIVPIITLVGMSQNYSLAFAFILALIVFWRVLYHNRDNHPNEMGLFLITFVTGTIYYLSFYFIEGREIFLMIIFLQFFLTLILKVYKLAFLSTKPNENKLSIAKWQLGKLLVLGGVTSVGILLYPIVYKILLISLQSIVYLIGLLGVPLVYLASLINVEVKPRNSEDGSDLGFTVGDRYALDDPSSFNADFILWIGAALICGLILYFILRTNGSFILRSDPKLNDDYEYSQLEGDVIHSKWLSTRPKNEIRRLFLDLEKFLAKKGHGRKESETVEDWLTKVVMNDQEREVISTIYRNVRYGHKDVTKEERHNYRDAIKHIKQQYRTKK